MTSMMYMMMLIILITMMIFLINLIFSIKQNKNREKISPFECGFDPMSVSRMPFSIQFFMISLIFLIFDIEIALLIPLIYSCSFLNKTMIFSSMLFIIVLIIGLFMEYMEQSMDWKF